MEKYNEKFYRVWVNINTRIKNKNNPRYKNYGKRGIKNLWNSFSEFEDDMYESYINHKKNNKTTSIERLDVNGHYCKENCIWITMPEQARNRTKNGAERFITFNNKTQNLSTWASEVGVTPSCLLYRIKNNISVNKVFSKKRCDAKLYIYKTKPYTLSELAKKAKVNRSTMSRRIKKGMSVEEAVETSKYSRFT